MNICFTPIKNSLLVLFLFAVLSGTHTAYAAAPTISSISPLSGTTTTEVAILGSGFSPTASDNIVLFGTIPVSPVPDANHSTTRMTVFPPKGFANERITVLVNGLSATSNQYFLYTSEYNCALTQHSFATNVDFSAGSLPNYIISGDIDGDGKTDLVVSDLLDAKISIYQNTTSANTIDASSFSTSTISCGVSVAAIVLNDLDGDKKPELLVATNSTSHVLIYRNISTPGTIKFAANPDVTGSTKSASKIVIADLDLDGKADLITTNTTSPSVSLLRNISTPGSIAFDAAYDISVSVIPTGITTGDLNRDSKPEIIVSTNGSTNIKIILNNGSSGGFNSFSFDVSTFLSTTGSITNDVELADIDSDGLLDIIVSNKGSNASNRSITVFQNTLPQGTKGTPPPVFVKAGDYAVPDDISNIAIADFNGDGRPDIAASIKSTTSQTTNSVAIYLNTLTTSGTIDAESFATPVSFSVGQAPNVLTIADFNNDGKADIATVNPDGNISVLKREVQTKPNGSITLSSGATQVDICPSTSVSLDIFLQGKSPWSLRYKATLDDGSYTYETITGITDTQDSHTYQFNVSPEERTVYQLMYVNDGQLCNSFDVYSTVNVRTISTPAIKPNTIPNGALGSTYNQTLTFDDPLTAPLNWSISAGLPVGLSFSHGVISGAPASTARNTYSFTVTASFATCDSKKQYHVLISNSTTTWNGTGWSNGIPDNVNGLDAIIDGNYNTAVNGPITCYHLAVNEGDTLFIKGNNDVTAAKNVINNGMIYKDCSRQLAITGTFAGAAVKIVQPQILPAFLSNGLINLTYNQALQVSIGESPTYTLTNSLPTGLSLTNGVIQGTPTTLGRFNFSISSTEYSGLCEASGNFTILIETADPHLKFASNGITKITGTAPFTYVPTTQSSGTIKYTIEPEGACATIDASGVISVTCGGPIKQYTITAIQAADFIYNADTATTILTVEKSKPELRFLKTGYILGSTTGNTIQYQTNSTGTVSIFQINNSNVAIVNMSGTVVPVAAGTFDILLKIAETPGSLPLDTLITMGVYSSYVAPVGTPATVVLEMGQDTIINILTTAQGITGEIDPSLTDIDIENKGVQYKFFATELGNFTIDNAGNVTILPFAGFIGTAKIGYVLTDENGTTSDVYYINITVNPPYVIPDLKANDVMTPNNDGLNDAFVIAYTDISKENSLTILDETGSTIYTANNYQNDWAGTTNKGDMLEPGVYFYAFKEKYSGRTLNGYIQIIK